VSCELGKLTGIPETEVYGRELKGGAAQMLTMPLDRNKRVKQFKLRCLSNDIVVGIMGITLL
jgi:5,10-methylenetetrahydrofolate reductase